MCSHHASSLITITLIQTEVNKGPMYACELKIVLPFQSVVKTKVHGGRSRGEETGGSEGEAGGRQGG